jgi:hypothetical protein
VLLSTVETGQPLPDVHPGARPVTTTDLLKLVALLFVFVDHHGYFFDPANPWWRLFGRVAAPIFFFLIGFARTRRVPWTWLAFGGLLTAINALEAGSLGGTMVNILINFAILRAFILPAVERHVMGRPLAVALLIGGCLPLIPITDGPLEYGTEGWLWAFATAWRWRRARAARCGRATASRLRPASPTSCARSTTTGSTASRPRSSSDS